MTQPTLINADCLSSQSPYNFYTDYGSIETWVNEILAQNQANPICFNDQHTTRERERDGYRRTNNFQFHAFIPQESLEILVDELKQVTDYKEIKKIS